MSDDDGSRPPPKLGSKFSATLAAANLLLVIVLGARMTIFAGEGPDDDMVVFGGLAIILLSMAGLAFALAGIQDPETRSAYSWVGLIGNGLPFTIGLLLLHYG